MVQLNTLTNKVSLVSLKIVMDGILDRQVFVPDVTKAVAGGDLTRRFKLMG